MNFKSKCSLYGVSTLLVSILLIPLQATAEIYKCENIKKEIFYNDKPCPALDKETEIAAVKDPKNGYVYPTFSLDKDKKNKDLSANRENNKFEKSKVDYQEREGLENSGVNEGSKSQKKKGGSNGSLASGLQENDDVVSSSGRKSLGSSSRASFDSKTRYTMKVEENTREPR